MVEFALILPVLVLLIFGLVEFGRGYNAQITLTHAAREGVRTLAVTKDSGEAVQATKDAATSLNPAQVSVSTTACNPGDSTTVNATYPFTYNIPLFGTNTITLTGKGVMRCGG
jgi:Flp pilus assembly protein TadG